MTQLLPDGFRFGVATAGFQIEGGFNGPGEPANNWAGWERAGRVEPSGIALDFWNRWPDQLDRAVAAGCDAFRLSVEWARVEPREGDVDTGALDRYGEILAGCHERGLQPLVTLHHFTHPGWLSEEFWLDPDAPARFAAWVALAVDRLGEACRHWVTINEINVLALMSWVLGAFPPGRFGTVRRAARATDHLLAAHVAAYDAIKARRPDAIVSTNNYSMSVYELDRLLVDVLVARRHGVARGELAAWLATRRRAYHDAVGRGRAGRREAVVRRVAAAAFPLDGALPRAIDAVYASPSQCTLDTTQLDYYAPYVGGALRWPMRELWDDPVDPAGLVDFARLATEEGLDVWIVENGLSNRVHNGRAYARRDGWDRVRYLEANLGAMVDALRAGLPVGSYFHWTLADNYEWGSYEPRFGLYAVDRERGVRWLDTDSMGGDSAGALRRIADGLRAGDASVVGR